MSTPAAGSAIQAGLRRSSRARSARTFPHEIGGQLNIARRLVSPLGKMVHFRLSKFSSPSWRVNRSPPIGLDALGLDPRKRRQGHRLAGQAAANHHFPARWAVKIALAVRPRRSAHTPTFSSFSLATRLAAAPLRPPPLSRMKSKGPWWADRRPRPGCGYG